MSDDLFGTPEHEMFRSSVRKFVEEELAPRAREFDEMGRIDKACFLRMGELGMLGIRFDPKWGGAGLDWSYTAVMFQELGRCDNAGVAMGISVQTDMATPSLHQFGSDELRRRFLVPAIKGEMVGAIAVTEPEAGSDVASIKTQAVRDGDDWVINGNKMYITNAATADWLCLLAVTEAEAGYKGFSQIIVPTDTPGFSYQLLDKIGNWGSDTGQLFFDNVRVPVSHTIGEIGHGFQQQMRQFQDERLVACVSSCAGARRLWTHTKDYCAERIIFGKPLGKMQVTQFKFVEMLTEITAARELIHACIRKRLRGEDATQEISMAKLFTGRMARSVADQCIQLYGGSGYMKDNVAGRAFVDTRLMSIGAGADEVMIHYLAKLLGL
ncbi:MAG: acyl-CoA dehydrogenase family protein [Myxococcales bacterium]|nr:acyl-CoA dehydrogenase family protein [Myxococcales bacterium]TDJ03206.1 MAG: acyl-CoA dehydrogenase [Deltaproteobacteria bacterium]TDJ06625.1 MAG: acyl-CoA dehydrogenase [Deltaproteobacteria bacterium]